MTGETRPGGATVAATYDGFGRLLTYTRSGDPAQVNTYNGLDDRVTASSGGTVHRFVYDADGRVMGEYGTSASDVVAETIWVSPEVANPGSQSGAGLPTGGDDGVGGYAPLVVATGSGVSAALTWVQGNHLGAPILYTDGSGTAVTPASYTVPGFPGQMRTLSDLYYNRYRDYDSSLGRYIQADPIGLEGGSNPYAYANDNPLRWADPDGKNPIVIAIGFCAVNPEVCVWLGTATSIALYNWYNNGPECPPALAMARPTKPTRKEKSTDYPSWADKYEKDPGEDCETFAKNIMDDKYGKGGWGRNNSEYNKILKQCRRGTRWK